MLRQEAGQTRYDVQTPESHGRVNAQAARQSCGCATGGELCSIRFLNGSFGALIKIPPRLSRPQSASRAKQQSHTESLLKLGDRLRDGRLAHAELRRRAGERAGIDHANKSVHRRQAIHPPFLRPKEVTLASTDLDARIRQNSADRASPVGISVSPPRWLLKRRKRRIVPRRRVRIAGPGRKPAPQNVSTKPGNRRSVDCGTGTSGRNPLPPGNVRARWGAMSVAYRPDTLATFH